MNKGSVVYCREKPVWVSDYRGIEGKDLVQVLKDTANAFIVLGEKEPEKCYLSLNDFTDAKASPEVLHAIKTNGKRVKPYTRKVAAIGINKNYKMFANMILAILGFNMRVFEFKDEALDWLTQDD